MKKLLLLILPLLLMCGTNTLAAQVTAVKTTSTTVTATAGTLKAPGGVTITITDSAINLTETFNQVVPSGTTSGITGQINTAAGAITWTLTLQTAGGSIAYTIVATPSGGTAAQGTGTF